jgi:hypothetical protein
MRFEEAAMNLLERNCGRVNDVVFILSVFNLSGFLAIWFLKI